MNSVRNNLSDWKRIYCTFSYYKKAFYVIARYTLHFLSLEYIVRTEVDDCSFIVSTDLSVHLPFFSFILSTSNSLFSFFLYIANLACNSADDVDSRHWLVGLMVMSIYRVTTNRPRSFSLASLSVGLFLRRLVYSRCVCAWFSLRTRRENDVPLSIID